MKGALILLALVAAVASAPQPRKAFHDHVEDFLDLIWQEAGHDLEHIMEHYLEFEEFRASLGYLTTANFRNLVNEMESLPEFKAVIDFLEKDNIDITYFLDLLDEMLEDVAVDKARHTLSGANFSAYIKDYISELPKDKLATLFDQKMAEDDAFKTAIDNLNSDEWKQTFDALWQSEVFKKEVDTLEANGIILSELMDQVMAIFGQY